MRSLLNPYFSEKIKYNRKTYNLISKQIDFEDESFIKYLSNKLNNRLDNYNNRFPENKIDLKVENFFSQTFISLPYEVYIIDRPDDKYSFEDVIVNADELYMFFFLIVRDKTLIKFFPLIYRCFIIGIARTLLFNNYKNFQKFNKDVVNLKVHSSELFEGITQLLNCNINFFSPNNFNISSKENPMDIILIKVERDRISKSFKDLLSKFDMSERMIKDLSAYNLLYLLQILSSNDYIPTSKLKLLSKYILDFNLTKLAVGQVNSIVEFEIEEANSHEYYQSDQEDYDEASFYCLTEGQDVRYEDYNGDSDLLYDSIGRG